MVAPGDLRIEEVPEPEPTPDAIVLKTRWSSVVAENIGIFTGSDPRLKAVGNPLYRGYPLPQAGEMIAEVIGVGKEVDGVQMGDRYVAYGDYEELHVVRPEAWTRVERRIPAESAISLPFSGTTLHCTRQADVGIGDNVFIIGQGPMGAMVTAWMALSGAGRVIVADKYAARLAVGRKFGATHTVETGERDLEEAVADALEGEHLDVIVDAGNHPATLPLAMETAQEQTRIVVLSWHTSPITIEDITGDFYTKELKIIATRAGGPPHRYRSPYLRWTGTENLRLIARFMAEGRYDPAPLVTHRMKLDRFVDAIAQLRDHPPETMKVLLEW